MLEIWKEFWAQRPWKTQTEETTMYTQNGRTITDDDARFYRDRYEENQQREQERQWREQEEREQRDHMRKQEQREEMQTAHDWPDAFWKGRRLAEHEYREEEKLNVAIEKDPQGFKPTHYFKGWLDELDTVEAAYQVEMQAVDEQIKAIKQAALNRVADRLLKLHPEAEAFAEALREDTPEYLTYW